MPAVSDTSPLFNLAVIHQLRELREQLTTIQIPEAVLDELTVIDRHPAFREIQQAIDDGWIVVSEVQNQALVQALRQDLDHGESAAIALALEAGVTTLLIDEREGREAARRMGLESTGALGILLRAKRQGRLDSVRDAMLGLRDLAGFYIAEALFQEVLKLAGEG